MFTFFIFVIFWQCIITWNVLFYLLSKLYFLYFMQLMCIFSIFMQLICLFSWLFSIIVSFSIVCAIDCDRTLLRQLRQICPVYVVTFSFTHSHSYTSDINFWQIVEIILLWKSWKLCLCLEIEINQFHGIHVSSISSTYRTILMLRVTVKN